MSGIKTEKYLPIIREKVMDMFSKELYELDKIVEKYMISEQQETIAEQRQKINEMQENIKRK